MRHLRPFSQETHGLHEPKLLPPFSKGHSEFLLEESFDGPFAGTAHSAKLSKRSTIAGVKWEAAEYMRDAIASGQKKALIQLPHEGGEEAGMEECARWLRTIVTEVPIGFIPSGDPFWMPA